MVATEVVATESLITGLPNYDNWCLCHCSRSIFSNATSINALLKEVNNDFQFAKKVNQIVRKKSKAASAKEIMRRFEFGA